MLELAGLVESQMDFGFQNTDAQYKRLAQKYSKLVSAYGVKVGSEPKERDDFVESMDPHVPFADYPISLSEIEMWINTFKVEALKAGLDPEDQLISKVIEYKKSKQKITRRAGD